jgi:DnaJ family protein C protein 19
MVYLLLGFAAVLVLWAILRFAVTAPALLVGLVVVLIAAGLARFALLPGLLLIALLIPWRRRRSVARPPVPAPGDADVFAMTRADAAELLGVPPDAGREEVIAAHARQRALREADGASQWATARLDRARDVLLGDV